MRFMFAITATVLVSAVMSTSAAAAGYCKLPDGSMGRECVVAGSGQVYACVTDLKDCGALSPTAPSGSGATLSHGTESSPATPVPENGQKITKSRSNIQNN